MPALVYSQDFANGEIPDADKLIARFEDIKTLLNTTKLDAANIQALAITAALIANGTITAGKFAAGAALANIGTGGITATYVGTDAVTPVKASSWPACKVYKTDVQSIPDLVNTPITWQAANSSEEFDTDGMHSNSTNPTRITFNTAGVYAISGNLTFAADVAGRREALLRINGAGGAGGTLIGNGQLGSPPSGSLAEVPVDALYKATAGDYVELDAFQNRGSALNVAVQDRTSCLAVHYLGKGT